MNQKLVDKYYDQIMKYVRLETCYLYDIKKLSYNNHSVKALLNKIIEDGNDYLLTDAFSMIMVHINRNSYTFREDIYNRLKAIASNDSYSIVEVMNEYVTWLVGSYKTKTDPGEILDKVLPDDYKFMLDIYKDARSEIWSNLKDYNDNIHKELLFRAIIAVMTNCIIDNEIDKFPLYCNCILANRTRFIEMLIMYGVNIPILKYFLEVCPMRDIYERFNGKYLK